MNSNSPSSVLTVYLLINDEELNIFHELMSRYPGIVLENSRKNSAGINVGFRQESGKKDDFNKFKQHLQRKLNKKRKTKASFLQSIKNILGIKK